ncbi:MAG: PD40 domain-containing protein, partial [Acidobacteriaceae bacterium]|nr:PD40 domain-containing protein [Acidobacteriaceae bacterium]
MRFSTVALILAAAGLFYGSDATLPVPSNLKPDGLPLLSRTIFDELNRYTESRSAALVDWHPTRREMLISTRFGDVSQLHRVAMPEGARQQLTFFPDAVTSGSFNPTNGDELEFSKDVGGGEFYQLYLQDLRAGTIRRLTEGDRSRNTGAVWSRDGKWIAYSSTARNGQDAD